MLSLQKIAEIVQGVSKKYPCIVKAELFGSYGRGQQNASSDIDVLVEYDYTVGPFGFDRLQFDTDLEKALGVAVNVCSERALKDHYLESIIESIKNNRTLLYERNTPKNEHHHTTC